MILICWFVQLGFLSKNYISPQVATLLFPISLSDLLLNIIIIHKVFLITVFMEHNI